MGRQAKKPRPGKRPDSRWDGNDKLKPGDHARYVSHAMRNFDVKPVNTGNVDEVRERIMWYFNNCATDDVKPSVSGVCNALGISSRTFAYWADGGRRGKEHQQLAQQVWRVMEEIHETMMQEGTLNPIVGIFLSKVHFGYVEKQEIAVTTAPDPLGEPIPAELLRDKYAESVQIDYQVRPELPAGTQNEGDG